MTSNQLAQWAGVGLTALLLLGGSIAAYVDVKGDIAKLQTEIVQSTKDRGELDTYDRFLQSQLREHGDRLLKSEAKQEGIEKTQERLERTMSDMLAEMKEMNENLIRMMEKK